MAVRQATFSLPPACWRARNPRKTAKRLKMTPEIPLKAIPRIASIKASATKNESLNEGKTKIKTPSVRLLNLKNFLHISHIIKRTDKERATPASPQTKTEKVEVRKHQARIIKRVAAMPF
jgi:hypothetical protein